MNESDLAPWALFHGGKWTTKRPTRPGYYPVATRDGCAVDPSKYKTIDETGKQAGVKYGEPGWLGWWWSAPMPPMPKTPGEWT